MLRRIAITIALLVGLVFPAVAQSFLLSSANPPAYDGLLTTRGQFPNAFNSTFKQLNSRSCHIARGNIVDLQILLVNAYLNNATETGSGADITFFASVEYPLGTETQLLWAGATSKVVASGALALSDKLTIAIPDTSELAIRIYAQTTAGVIYQGFSSTTFGTGTCKDGFELSTTTLTNKTMSDTITGGAPNILHPYAVIGTTTRPTVAIFTDSLGDSNDSYTNSSGDLGVVARWIGPNFAYSKAVANGDRAQTFITGSTLRRAILPYVTAAIFENGANDYGSGRTVAQMSANMQTEWAFATDLGKQAFQTTITPVPTATSNSWTNCAGQTQNPNDANRTTLNSNGLAGLIPGATAWFDVAATVQDPVTPGCFVTNGSPNSTTTDGTHGTALVYVPVQNALQNQASTAIHR